ncbi:TPA: hypothetical protein ACW7Z0_005202, partial [Klebsiella pneumoniae]
LKITGTGYHRTVKARIAGGLSSYRDLKPNRVSSGLRLNILQLRLDRGLTLNGTVSHVKDFLSDKSEYCGQ